MLAHSSAFHAAEARASLPRKWLLGFDSPRSEAEEAVGERESVEPHATHPEEETLGEARAAMTSGGVFTAAHGLGRCRPRVEAARNYRRPSMPAAAGEKASGRGGVAEGSEHHTVG